MVQKRYQDFSRFIWWWDFTIFSSLSPTYQLLRSHLFRYFQVRHCTTTTFHSLPSLSLKLPCCLVLSLNLYQKAFISKICNYCLSFTENGTIKAKDTWRETTIHIHIHTYCGDAFGFWGKAGATTEPLSRPLSKVCELVIIYSIFGNSCITLFV